MPDIDDETIDDALRRMGGWAQTQAHLPGPAAARRTARNRRTVTAVAGGGTALAAATAVAIAISTLGGGTSVQPAPADSPPPPTTAAPTPSAAATATRTTGAAAAAPPVTDPTPPADTALGTAATTGSSSTTAPAPGLAPIPDDLDLMSDLRRFEGGDVGIVRSSQLTDGDFGLCGGSFDTSAAAAVDAYVSTAPEAADNRALLVFADADAAVAFMAGLRSQATACEGVPGGYLDGSITVRTQEVPGPWGEGTAVMEVWLPPDRPEDPWPQIANYTLAVRTGSAVVLRHARGEFYVSEPFVIGDSLLADLQEPLDTVAPRLCLWTEAGC